MNEENKSKDTSSCVFACLTIVLFFAVIIVLILLGIFWEYPGSSDLGDTLWYFAKIPFIIGAVCTPTGLALYFSEKNKSEDCNIPIIATITEVQEESHAFSTGGVGGYKTYTPYYTYNLNGENITVRGRGYSTGENKYQVGEQVQMYVTIGEPYNYRIDAETKKTYIVGLVFTLIGIPILLLGIGMWVYSLFLI